jgi:phosphoribosylglycinamide formyltransferase 2
LFGKPEVNGERRMGVCLAKGATIEEARRKANEAAGRVKYSLNSILI